jgi:hypothetical protein
MDSNFGPMEIWEMPPSFAKFGPLQQKKPTIDFWSRLKEIDLFFEGRGREHQTLRRLVQRLEKAKIPYAIMGAMAVNAHGAERTTKDVEVLVTQEGLDLFRLRYVGKSYDAVPERPRRFVEKRSKVSIDFLVTGRFPGSGKPGPVAFPHPDEASQRIKNAKVVTLPQLIQLKLAARRHQDFGDVVFLIRIHDLDESYLEKLHPSVRDDFVECLEEKRREDEYEARE